MEFDFENELEFTEGLTKEAMAEISAMANRQLEAEKKVIAAEESLKQAKQDLKQIREIDLPQALISVGVSEFSLTTGEKIEVKNRLKASIPVKHKTAAFQWLRDNNAGSLIKNEVITSFGKGDDESARSFVNVLQKRGFMFKQKEVVHSGTLAAYIKTQLENGFEVPLDIMGVYQWDEAKISKG